ncbi:putative phytol kinase 3, chloroplastic [Drosera capensis]
MNQISKKYTPAHTLRHPHILIDFRVLIPTVAQAEQPVNPTVTVTLTLTHASPTPIQSSHLSIIFGPPRQVPAIEVPATSPECEEFGDAVFGRSGGERSVRGGVVRRHRGGVWKETAKRGIFDQKLNRKLVHVSIGLVFMLCWPLFSSGYRGAVLAGLIPGVNIIHMLLLGLGLLKDEATVKSMSRYGDYRELLKGPLYYASTITIACMVFWRTSPIGMAAICNLCAGDGFADIIGRRFGHQKIPFNRSKSIVGSIAMASAGFLASVGYMFYFSRFGYIQASWDMVFGFLIVSLAATVVESLPISTDLDDNLTVPLTSLLVGILVL